MAEASRTAREKETREAEKRETTWTPSALLPSPLPQPGYTFRWIRTSSFGVADNKNVSARIREGWEPVKASEHPELQIMSDRDSSASPTMLRSAAFSSARPPLKM